MSKNNVLILDAFWADNKPFPTEEPACTKVGQVLYSGYTGDARHLGWMDLVLLRRLILKNNISHIILENLDLLGKMAQANGHVQICTAYITKRGQVIRIVPDKQTFKHCKPFYHIVEMGGWDFSPEDFDIPERAKWYMRYLLIQTNIKSITCMTNNVKITAFMDEDYYITFKKEQI